MNYSQILILVLLTSVPITAQEVATAPIQPVFQVLSESTVQNRDGSSITFRQVAPPEVTPLPQPAPPAAAPVLSAAEEAALSRCR